MSGCHPPKFCYCDCHKPWFSTQPPVCVCTCRQNNIVSDYADRVIKEIDKQVSETLSLCPHGKPSKFPCLLCAPTHSEISLIELVDSITKCQEQIIALNNRCDIMHEHKLRQIDENRKVDRYLDELEKVCTDNLAAWHLLDERVKKLESSGNYNKDYGLELNKQVIELSEKYLSLVKLVLEHDEYLKKIDKIALCDPDKILANEKVLEERINNLEKASKTDFDNAAQFIYQGAQTHASILKCEAKIKELEKVWQQCSDANPIAEIEKRFDKLELMNIATNQQLEVCLETNVNNVHERINALEKELQDIIPRVWSAEQKGLIAIDAIEGNCSFKNKQPHKCPVCDGEGKIIINNGTVLTSYPPQYPTKECISCNGKGLVWG